MAFYCDVLGMQRVATFGSQERPIHLLDIGDGTHLELFAPVPGISASPPHEAPYRHIALLVNDVCKAVERVRAAGRPISVEAKNVVLGGRPTTIAFFEGPGGESVEFFHQHCAAMTSPPLTL